MIPVYVAACAWGRCGALRLLEHKPVTGEYFGTAIAVDETGRFIAVGAYGRDAGRGTVYYTVGCADLDSCAITSQTGEGDAPHGERQTLSLAMTFVLAKHPTIRFRF